eukprot:CAMPEP_0182512278 /NCGR_PEP_ID=MMETSP1321-20130603/31913_1 /TAXON_ID=91990 /ORGANISM="Bolidomonas sp., Strain RCC1657" /LENGTH=578 /DNA_ID=CAMNT_0024719071 /DNA_START=99 /DNA_END=1832 /DNA_ORIENTATION=-
MIHPTPSSLAAQLPPALEKSMEETHGDLSKRTHSLLADLLATLPLNFEQVERLDAIEQNLKGEGDNDVVKDVEAEIRAAFIKAIRYSANQREDKRDMKEKRTVEKRNALASVEEGVKALASIQELNQQNEDIRFLGVDPRTFMDFGLTALEAFKLTSTIMTKLIFVVVLFSASVWSFLYFVRGEIVGLTEPTAINRAAVSSFMAWASVFWVALWFAIAFFHGLNRPFVYIRHLVLAAIVYLMIKMYFWYYHESSMNNLVVSFIYCVHGTLCTIFFATDWMDESQNEGGILKDRVASKRAQALLEGKKDFIKVAGWQKVKASTVYFVPVLFIFAVILAYILIIFELFKTFDSSAWKLSVTVLAFGLKVAGNKAMLKLVQGSRGWVADLLLYCYEYATALMVRMLQMSLPDEQTAQLVGLLGAVAEVCVRIFFFNLYLKAGVHGNKLGMTKDEQYKFAVRGKTRVQDGSNDMLVEYVSSITSCFLLIIIAPLNVLNLASNTDISTNTVLILTAYQLVPELFLDFYVTFMETFCGLSRLHENYWDPRSGGDTRSKITVDRWGDIGKSIPCKLFVTLAQTVL